MYTQFPTIDVTMVEKMMPHFAEQFANLSEAMNEKSTRCGRKTKKENEIWLPFHRFNKDQISVNMNKKGLMTVSAAKENIEDTGRNGQRKTVVHVEETVQLPSYVIEDGKLNEVKGEYRCGHFVVTLPEKVEKEDEKKSSRKSKEGPIEIEIMSE